MNKNITIFGVGKLGLCFALNLEKAGFNVLGVDISEDYVYQLNSRKLKSSEDRVEEMLQEATHFKATTNIEEGLNHSDTLFVLVATPSLESGEYDHSQIESLVQQCKFYGQQEKKKDLIIGCTTMPGYCDSLQKSLVTYNYEVLYNPEFIAQGTIIRDQQYPDMILIGSHSPQSAENLQAIHSEVVENKPAYKIMTPLSAEICKISLNCFITTKISFTNMIGDLASKVGAEPQVILDAIGSDSRVGEKCTKHGYGYGGPCFPRDNRALGIYAKQKDCYIDISDATDECNRKHLDFMVETTYGNPFSRLRPKKMHFDTVTYKPESIMIEESQQLAYAVRLAKEGIQVTITERPEVIEQVKELYGDLFIYNEK